MGQSRKHNRLSEHDAQQALCKTQQRAILFLRGEGYPLRKIADFCFVSVSTISHATNDEGRILGGLALSRLSQLASIEGYDGLSRMMMAPTKAPIPVEGMNTDGSIDDQALDLGMDMAKAREAFERCRISATPHLQRVVMHAFTALLEAQHPHPNTQIAR